MSYSWARPVPHTASTTRRAVAFGFDLLIIAALAWIFTFFVARANALVVPDFFVLGQKSAAIGILWVVSIFELVILLVYTTLFEGLGGRTPGKLVAGLRVVRPDGVRASVGDAFLRNLLRLVWVTPFGPAFILLDAWSLRVTELDQRLGDLAAGTVVVHERGA